MYIGIRIASSIIFFCVIYALLVTKALDDISIPYIVLISIPILFFLSIKISYILPLFLYVFIIPFDSVSALESSGVGTSVTKLFGVLSIGAILGKNLIEKTFRKPKLMSLWWFLFTIYGIITTLWAIDPDYSVSRIGTAVSLFGLYIVVSSTKISEKDFKGIIFCLFAGGLLTSFFLLFDYISSGFNLNNVSRYTISILGRTANPNGVALSLLLPFSIALQFLLVKKEHATKLICFAAFSIISFGLLLTGSRSAMLASLFILASFLIHQRKFYSFLIGGGFIGLIFFIVNLQFQSGSFYESLFEKALARFEIWDIGFRSAESFGLFGAGLNNFTVVYEIFSGSLSHTRGSHNIFLSVVVEFGVIGILLFITSIVTHLKLARNNNDLKIVMLRSAAIGIVIHGLFHNCLWDKTFWLIWMLISMYSDQICRNHLKRNVVIDSFDAVDDDKFANIYSQI